MVRPLEDNDTRFFHEEHEEDLKFTKIFIFNIFVFFRFYFVLFVDSGGWYNPSVLKLMKSTAQQRFL